MNWYRYVFAQGLQPYLQNLGVRPEVFNFITSLPSNQAQYFVNAVRKHPKMSLQELQQYIQPKQVKQIDPYFQEERDVTAWVASDPEVRYMNPQVQKWLLVHLRKARQGRLDIPYSKLVSLDTIKPVYYHLIDMIQRWKRTNELNDFLEDHPNFDVASYTPEDFDELVNEWHRTLAGRGTGKIYGPTDPSLVVYGPKWENKENQDKQGWTVQEVRTENDLAVEGHLMNHCVSGYYYHVAKGDIRIFSLRDPANHPHATIETDPKIENFEQIQGNSNSTPDAPYQMMIREWVQKFGHPAYFGEEEENAVNAYDNTIDEINGRLDKIVRGQEDEYGLKTRLYVDIDNFENLIYRAQQENKRSCDGDYVGPVCESADIFVDAVLSQHGADGIARLEQALTIYEEKVMDDVYKNWNWEPYENPPNETQYETDEEYEKAEEEWRERMNEAESEQMQEEMGKYLPYAFLQDAFKSIRWLEEKGKLKPVKKKKTKVVANNWYRLIK